MSSMSEYEDDPPRSPSSLVGSIKDGEEEEVISDIEAAGIPGSSLFQLDDPHLVLPPEDVNWEYKPTKVLTVLKDASSADAIAAAHVFCFGGS